MAPYRTTVADGEIEVLVVAPNARCERFADTVRRALRGRHPRRRLPLTAVQELGLFDESLGELRLQNAQFRALTVYLGRTADRNEIEASDSRRQERADIRRRARTLQLQGRTAEALELRQRHQIWNW